MGIMQNGTNPSPEVRAALIDQARRALADYDTGPGDDIHMWHATQAGAMSQHVRILLGLLDAPEPEPAPARSAARAALAQVEACRGAVTRIGGWERGLAAEVTAALCGRGAVPLPDLIARVEHASLPARLAGDRAVVLTALRALDGAR